MLFSGLLGWLSAGAALQACRLLLGQRLQAAACALSTGAGSPSTFEALLLTPACCPPLVLALQMHVMYADVRDAPSSPGRLQRLQQLCAAGEAGRAAAALELVRRPRPHRACSQPAPPAMHRAAPPAVVAAFSQAGLVLPQDERAVKLHATLINTRYRQRSGGGGSGAQGEAQQGQPGQPRREQRQPFGGRGLLERHAAADFGTVQLPAVHISQRGAYDERTGFYRCFASLALR